MTLVEQFTRSIVLMYFYGVRATGWNCSTHSHIVIQIGPISMEYIGEIL